MKQKLRFLMLTLLCAVFSTAWGTDYTYTFTSKSWGATLNGVSADWTSGKAGNQLTTNQGVQITTGTSGANATSPIGYSNVSKIVVKYCTNAKAGAGAIKVKVGNGSEKSFNVSAPSSGGTTLKETEFSFNPNESGKVQLTATCSTNSIYIHSITITENNAAVNTPTFNPSAGTYTSEQQVTIACSTEGSTIYYTTNGSTPDNNSTQYTTAITISETTTIKAIAYKGTDASSVATATYTILEPISISEVRNLGSGTVFTQGIVTSINGETAYIQDDNAAICVYGDNAHSLANLTIGDKIRVQGTLGTYNGGLLEITNPTYEIVTQNNVVNPTVMTIAEVNASTNQGWLVKIENAIVSGINGRNVTISQDENRILVYFTNTNDITFFENDIISLTGNIGYYNTTQIANPTNIHVKTDKYYIAGDWTNWQYSKREMTKNADGSYTLVNQVVAKDQKFKIIKIADGTSDDIWWGSYAEGSYWGINENSHSDIALNVNNGPDFKIEYAGTWSFTISFDANGTPKLTVNGDWLPKFYLLGDFNNWVARDEYKFTNDETTNKYTLLKGIPQDNKFKIGKKIGSEITTWYSACSDGPYWFEEKDCEKELSLTTEGSDEQKFWMKLLNLADWKIEFDPVNLNIVLSNYVSEYATLPFEYNDGKDKIAGTSGLTYFNLGSDYAETNHPKTKLKFDNESDYLILKFKERPGILTFNIKGNSFSNSNIFTVQTSEDGTTYTDLRNYNSISNSDEGQHEVFDNLGENVRYIKWVYTEKNASGNVGLGNIKLEKYVAPFTFTINQLATDGESYYATIADLGEGYYKVTGNVDVKTVIINEVGKLDYTVFSKDDIIPGNAAYLVVASAAGEYSFPATSAPENEVTLGENMLISTGEGNVTADNMLAAAKAANPNHEGDFKFYKLSLNGKNEEGSVGFYWGEEGGVAFNYTKGHQAFLAVPQTEKTTTAAYYLFDGTTGIYNVMATESESNNATYTLSGIRVDNKQLPKGIYIKNGKKVVVR